METDNLKNISPIDGRYQQKTEELRDLVSEFGLMKYRVQIEIEWFIHLANQKNIPQIPKISKNNLVKLKKIYQDFSYKDAKKIKIIEKNTNHDVKAVEYFVKEKVKEINSLKKFKEFIHFGCTSEDINNLAYGLMIKEISEKILLKEILAITKKLRSFSRRFSSTPMISRTHGQNASPTTVGKEFANFLFRLERISKVIHKIPVRGKLNGAVGNYNAYVVAFPKVNWELVSERFVTKLGLSWSPYTTQVEPKDALSKLMHGYQRVNNVLIDFSRDIWGYISLGYFSQKPKDGEIGSSTMPHKINPIDFENAEGNLGLANALFGHISSTITISRWQRDLTDSTIMRNIGSAFSYTLIALKSLNKGIDKLIINKINIDKDLDNSFEVLTEAVQTVMRKYLLDNGYELMKELSRGKNLSKEDLHQFIDTLAIPGEEKNALKKLTPRNYIGLADKLAKDV